MLNSCICGSNKPMDQCCGRFLTGGQQAKTPEQLMRSRYSAYALGGHGDYLLHTWFPATAQGLTVAGLSQKTCEWIKLDVLHSSQKGDSGTVEFKAFFREGDNNVKALHEKSVFQRLAGRWYYVGGEVAFKD